MFRFLLTALTLFAISFSAQADWSVRPMPTEKSLRSVGFSDPLHGVAVGDDGTIIRTTTGGATWTLGRTDIGDHLTAVDVKSGTTWHAVSSIGTYFGTTIGGWVWNRHFVDHTSSLTDVFFVNDTVGIAVGTNRQLDSGRIHRTTDGGKTWSRIPNPANGVINHTLYAVHFYNELRGVAVGGEETAWSTGKGVVLTTTDGGQSWKHALTTEELITLTDVRHLASNVILAVGTVPALATGIAYQSFDGGQTWSTYPHTLQTVNAMSMRDLWNGYIVGHQVKEQGGKVVFVQTVAQTADGGRTWTAVDERVDGPPLTSVAVAGEYVHAVGITGYALRGEADCSLPIFTRNLDEERNLVVGSKTMLRVSTRGGDDDRYQWRKNGVIIPGATDSILVFWPVRSVDAGTYDVVVTNDCGFVTSVTCTVTVVDGGVLVSDRRIIEFGIIEPGTVRDTTLVNFLRNEGTADVVLRQVRPTSSPAVSVVSDVAGVTIRPGQSLNVTLRFTPVETADLWSALVFDTDSDIDPVVHVTGTAVSEGDGALTTPYRAIDFGQVPILETTDSSVAGIIRNTSNEPLEIQAIWVVGDDQAVFSINGAPELPFTLAAGEELDLSVSASPHDGRIQRAILTFISEDNTVSIPVVAVSSQDDGRDIINFGAVSVGTSRDTTIEVYHIVDGGMWVNSVDLAAGPYTVVETTPTLPAILGGYEPLRITVRYAPTVSGSSAAAMRVAWLMNDFPFYVERVVLRGEAPPVTSTDEDPTATYRIAPQPASDIVTVTLPGLHGVIDVQVVNITGQIVARSSHTLGGDARIVLNTAYLPSGSYTVHVRTVDGSVRTVPLHVRR